MKYFGIIPIFILLSNCSSNNQDLNRNRQFSPIIAKWDLCLDLKVSVRPISTKEIYADLTYTNRSGDSILLYKSLFPFNNTISEDIFSIFQSEDHEMIKYTGPRNGNYLKLGPDDDKGIVIPDTLREKFIMLLPGDSLQFYVNIASAYDFSRPTQKKDLTIFPSIYLPAVTADFKQIFEKDSLDNKEKPVYYIVTLPRNRNLDSMQIKFSIPDIANP
jgi:hypothetical protein